MLSNQFHDSSEKTFEKKNCSRFISSCKHKVVVYWKTQFITFEQKKKIKSVIQDVFFSNATVVTSQSSTKKGSS